MIVFSLICSLLIVLAFAFILPPLRHPDRIAVASTMAEANLAVYRRQLAEMESDLRYGIITNEQFLRDREELEQRLIRDLPKDSHQGRKKGPAPSSGILPYALGVGLPVAALLLYLALGAPASLIESP